MNQELGIMKTLSRLRPNEQKAIAVFMRLLRETLRENLIAVKLFGSRARGTARPDSDFDFLILIQRVTPLAKEQVSAIATQILLEYQCDFTTIIRSQSEYRRAQRLPTVFSQLVDRYGISV